MKDQIKAQIEREKENLKRLQETKTRQRLDTDKKMLSIREKIARLEKQL
ncbi:hypothetical protein [Taibaiella sp. KBW10]|nr:hypothetical protein [Taibaiella sp. KBW10]